MKNSEYNNNIGAISNIELTYSPLKKNYEFEEALLPKDKDNKPKTIFYLNVKTDINKVNIIAMTLVYFVML